MFSSKISARVLILKKKIHLFMFKEFRWPENTDKPLSVQNFLQNRPEITKTMVVDLS